MPTELVDNFTSPGTQVQLTQPAAATDTEIVVTSAASPQLQTPGGQFRVIAFDPSNGNTEIMIVDSDTSWSPTWSVTRGAEGTKPLPFTQGSVIKHVITAGALLSLLGNSSGIAGASATLVLDTQAADIKMDGVADAGSTGKAADAGHIHPTDTSRAPVDSPIFTTKAQAPTPAPGDNSTNIATTAYVQSAISAALATSTGGGGTPTAPPVNSTQPQVSGSVASGYTLSCTTGTWTQSPTAYTYQWFDGNAAIVGATNASYVVQAADVGAIITCQVTATNSLGSTTATSNAVTSTTNPAPASNAILPTPTALGTNWTLIFDEEWAALSTSIWNQEDGYTNKNGMTVHAANESIVNGQLALAVPTQGSGAEVSSIQALFKVGDVIEFRFFFPGSGQEIYNWPAVWCSGPNWPHDGEIDIAEGLGRLTVNYHYYSNGNQASNGANPTLAGNWGGTWMTATCYRTATEYIVYWNQQLARTVAAQDSGNAQQVIMTAGDGNTSQYGSQGTVYVDYVRIWSPGSSGSSGGSGGTTAQPGHIQGTGMVFSTSTAAQTITLNTPAQAGNCLVLVAVNATNNAPITSVTSADGTWEKVGSIYGTATGTLDVWICPGIAGGTNQVTFNYAAVPVTPSGSPNAGAAVISEYTGVAASSPLDGNPIITTSASSTPFNTGAYTPSAVPELVIAAACTQRYIGTQFSASGGFTDAESFASDYGYGDVAYVVPATSVAQTASLSTSGGSGGAAGIIFGLKP
jgi:hypothetical protein